MSLPVRIINHEEVGRLLPMAECVDLMGEALKAYSAGRAKVPLRSMVRLPERPGGLGLMAGHLETPDALGLKVVTVIPGNEGTPYESHQGVVLLFDSDNGRLLCAMDAAEITAVRTAAASGLATRVLARADAGDLALIGTGTQGRTHLEAMAAVRSLRRVRVWGRNRARAEAFVQREAANYDVTLELADSVEAAVDGADLICTVTGAKEPVVQGAWIADGAHINAAGACISVAREFDTEAVRRSSLFTDSRESATNESGDYLIPLNEGAISEDHLRGEVGEVLLGRIPGRTSPEEITFFNSLGIAVEDLAAARHIYERAEADAVGATLEIGGLRREAD